MGSTDDRESPVLHALRLAGMAPHDVIASRLDFDADDVHEVLLDQQAFGNVAWNEFGASSGCSLTPRGKEHAERLLAAELDAAGARTVVEEIYGRFLPFNDRLKLAVTRWQLRPTGDDPHAANDHRDPVWDSSVLAELADLSRELRPLVSGLVNALPRFARYDVRFSRALARAAEGDREWVDGVGIDSCHTVWFELHENLLATLRLQR